MTKLKAYVIYSHYFKLYMTKKFGYTQYKTIVDNDKYIQETHFSKTNQSRIFIFMRHKELSKCPFYKDVYEKYQCELIDISENIKLPYPIGE